MERYTADAVSLLAYLVDSLPSRTDQIFAAAEAGEAVIQAPSTALGETLYSVSREFAASRSRAHPRTRERHLSGADRFRWLRSRRQRSWSTYG